MDKDEAIRHIENLYPPDSSYPDTATIGRNDLEDALAERWRDLPEPILVSIALRQKARQS